MYRSKVDGLNIQDIVEYQETRLWLTRLAKVAETRCDGGKGVTATETKQNDRV